MGSHGLCQDEIVHNVNKEGQMKSNRVFIDVYLGFERTFGEGRIQ